MGFAKRFVILFLLDERIRSQSGTPTENIHSNPALLNRWRKYIEPLSDSDTSTGSVEDIQVRRPKIRYECTRELFCVVLRI